MVNYDNIRGVGYRRYEGDDSEPTVEQDDAHIDEMYVDGGRLTVSVDTVDGHLNLSIPILPVDKWDSFVASIPTWGN